MPAQPNVRERVSWPYPAFENRFDAGRRLVEWIGPIRDTEALVFGLPRGGIPVGRPLAEAVEC